MSGDKELQLLFQSAKKDNAIVVCKNIWDMRNKAITFNITDLKFMSYEEFDAVDELNCPVYIHDITSYISKNKNVIGYSITC